MGPALTGVPAAEDATVHSTSLSKMETDVLKLGEHVTWRFIGEAYAKERAEAAKTKVKRMSL